MAEVNLEFIYEQFKEKYDVEIMDSMDAGLDLWVDTDVLIAKTEEGTLYLFNDFESGTIFIENADKSARCNLYPDDTPTALDYVSQFLEGTGEYKMIPYKM